MSLRAEPDDKVHRYVFEILDFGTWNLGFSRDGSRSAITLSHLMIQPIHLCASSHLVPTVFG
jgi:hypothetical protein